MGVGLWLIGLSAALYAADPDYTLWNEVLQDYYDPQHGFDYQGLKARDISKLDATRQAMAQVHVQSLTGKEQLAYWMNLYNISIVGLIVDQYPVRSIKNLSRGLNPYGVFDLPVVRYEGGIVSPNRIENQFIREGFKDPRVHFAINCAAKSCPPLRPEAYVGSRLDEQLDDQARRFLAGPSGARIEVKPGAVTLRVTKIADWFKKDFESWGGGLVPFLRKYLTADRQAQIDAARHVRIVYDNYNWDLNDWDRGGR